MEDSYTANLALWPASPMAPEIMRALWLDLGIDVQRLHRDDHSVALYRIVDGSVVMQVTLTGLAYGVTDLEQLRAQLRIAEVSYVVWSIKDGDPAGVGLSYEPCDGTEFEYTVLAGGEPVLRAHDLVAFDALPPENVMGELRRCLRQPLPESVESLSARETHIAIETIERPGSSQAPRSSRRRRPH
jgi:hypothetical protein